MLARDPGTCNHGLPLNSDPPCFFCARQSSDQAAPRRSVFQDHRNPPAAETRPFPQRRDSQRKGGAAKHRKDAAREQAAEPTEAPAPEPLAIVIIEEPERAPQNPRSERYARLASAVQRVESMQSSLANLLHDLKALQYEVAACRGLSRAQASTLEELQGYMRKLGTARPVPLVEIFPHTPAGDRNRAIIKKLHCQGVLGSVGLELADGVVTVRDKP